LVVEIEADRRLPKPVTLAAVKSDPRFADLGLVRMSRLSVFPVPPNQWKMLLAMAGEG
jgi:predicted RNA-binding protein with PUA-like domain